MTLISKSVILVTLKVYKATYTMTMEHQAIKPLKFPPSKDFTMAIQEKRQTYSRWA
jgi:hypothetical protein